MSYIIGLGLVLLGCLPGILELGLILEVLGGLVSIYGVLYFLSEVIGDVNQL